MTKIYLDNNATTRIDPEVLIAMQKDSLPYNPSSIHFYGREANRILNESKATIAKFLKTTPANLTFTSGGTEAVNMAIRGIVNNYPSSHIIASKIDHTCVYNTLLDLPSKGHNISFIDVDKSGAMKVEDIEKNITENTKAIITSSVNTETGVKTDIEAIAKIAKEKNIFLIVDAVGSLGKELFTIPAGVSAMCFSSHKMHGPQGVGLLYLKSNIKFTPLYFGGPQEDNKRPGTENLMGIIGFAKAIDLLNSLLPKATKYMQELRDHFEDILKKELKNIYIHGEGERICNISNICFKEIDAESLLIMLDQRGIMASHGSACASKALAPSRALLNMGVSTKDALSSIRFSLSRNTKKEEIDKSLEVIISLVKNLRNI